MQNLKWYQKPIVFLLMTLCALGASYYIYIDNFLRVQQTLREFIVKYKLEERQELDMHSWVMIISFSVLVLIIIICMSVIFVYYQKMIQLYRMQQNFINGFTHELKTPIASLRLFLDTFTKHELSREDQLKYLEYMKKDTDRLADNVEQILHLGKIEDRSYKGEIRTLEVSAFVKGILDKIDHLHDSLDISFNVLVDEGVWARLDPKLFEACIMNIITNATRYKKLNNEVGKLVITLKVNNQKISLSFKDDGIGIEKKYQKKIFKKFFQVGKSVKGSGLGLYFVWQVLKLHKGNVIVDSEGVNQGATFTLVFPGMIKV